MEWGALEWVVALVLLALVVGIVWFMTQGGAVQDRLSGRGQEHPEIDEGDEYLRDEEGSRYDAGGQDATEFADDEDDDTRAGAGAAGRSGRRGSRDRGARPGGTARRKSTTSREKPSTEHQATDLFDQESESAAKGTARAGAAGAGAAGAAAASTTEAGAHALGDEDEATDAVVDPQETAVTHEVEKDAQSSSGPLGSVTDSDAEVEAGTVDEGDLGATAATASTAATDEADASDEATGTVDADEVDRVEEVDTASDDPSDIEAGTSTDPGELHSIEAEDPDDVAFPGYEEPAESLTTAEEDEATPVHDHEHLSDFTGPGSDGSDTLPAGTPEQETGWADDQEVVDEVDGDEDASTDDDVQPATGAPVVDPGTVDAPEADFPADDEVPHVEPAQEEVPADEDADAQDLPAEDDADEYAASSSAVTATSTQEWLGRGEVPADMDTDDLDPYSAWQQGR
ncbi:hypothetical protein [Kytococcus sedentarius]|uniref:hypothetical protein n=1 Tax=Kytococcus sedentarius TaxID=1276 RepID=UPI0035BC5754